MTGTSARRGMAGSAAAAVLAAGLLLPGTPAAAQPGTPYAARTAPALAKMPAWKVVPSPNPGPASASVELNGVSCVSAASCTAVGFGFVSSGGGVRSKTLIESWNGTRWSVAASPNPAAGAPGDTLQGVSCVSVASCTAVGSTGSGKTLIESRHQDSWSVVPSPNAGPASASDDLLGVSCLSAGSCTAAGGYENRNSVPPAKTLIESWNGTRWTVLTSPNLKENDVLSGVSCGSAASCTAAGSYQNSSRGMTKSLIESR